MIRISSWVDDPSDYVSCGENDGEMARNPTITDPEEPIKCKQCGGWFCLRCDMHWHYCECPRDEEDE